MAKVPQLLSLKGIARAERHRCPLISYRVVLQSQRGIIRRKPMSSD
jgi:hypothetical protein